MRLLPALIAIGALLLGGYGLREMLGEEASGSREGDEQNRAGGSA